ncbi:MAG: fibronectin type III domain-containing protein [Treponema sp.]|jgi:hypothetical protein|nr:fibronectin type III domain-containing protein [Treponema sp.]
MNRSIISCLAALSLSLVFAACPWPGRTPDPEPEEEKTNTQGKTTLEFDNRDGDFRVSVYTNPARQDAQKIIDVEGLARSEQIAWTPNQSGYTFYFTYHPVIDGIRIPYNPGTKGAVVARIDEHKNNTIPIPILASIVSPNESLTNDVYLSIENSGFFPLRVLLSNTPLTPLYTTSSILNAGEKGVYTISAGTASPYHIEVNAINYPFSDSTSDFQAGHWYSFNYNNGIINAVDQKPLTLANVGSGIEPPSAPTGLTATVQSSSEISLSWNVVPGATGYKAYYSRDASSGYETLAQEPQTDTDTRFIGLLPGSAYYFKVSTVNRAGEGPLSAYVAATTIQDSESNPSTVTSAGSIKIVNNTQYTTDTIVKIQITNTTTSVNVVSETISVSKGNTRTYSNILVGTYKVTVWDDLGYNWVSSSFTVSRGVTKTLTYTGLGLN